MNNVLELGCINDLVWSKPLTVEACEFDRYLFHYWRFTFLYFLKVYMADVAAGNVCESDSFVESEADRILRKTIVDATAYQAWGNSNM